jgi:hypothetical protein
MSKLELVKQALDSDEPRYSEVASLGPGVLAYLRDLVSQGDPLTASKAVHAASLIPGKQSQNMLAEAAHSPESTVRVAVAGASRNLPSAFRNSVLLELLDDLDGGVRKTALNSIGGDAPTELRAKVYHLSREAADSDVRMLATRVVRRLSSAR